MRFPRDRSITVAALVLSTVAFGGCAEMDIQPMRPYQAYGAFDHAPPAPVVSTPRQPREKDRQKDPLPEPPSSSSPFAPSHEAPAAPLPPDANELLPLERNSRSESSERVPKPKRSRARFAVLQ